MAAAISLYLDENLPPVIAEQLRQRGIDAVCVRDLGLLGDTDPNHLTRATQMPISCGWQQKKSNMQGLFMANSKPIR